MTQNKKIKKNEIAIVVIAIIILGMTFYGAQYVHEYGYQISQIRSVGGKTMEEAYYLCLGNVYIGVSWIVRAIGLFFVALIWTVNQKD